MAWVEVYPTVLDIKAHTYRTKCIRCSKKAFILKCNNCDGTVFVVGQSTDFETGLFCNQCGIGATRRTCAECGCNYPLIAPFLEWIE